MRQKEVEREGGRGSRIFPITVSLMSYKHVEEAIETTLVFFHTAVVQCALLYICVFCLQDLSRDVIIDRKHAQILTFITYIGCGLSAIFLGFTLLTYLLFK